MGLRALGRAAILWLALLLPATAAAQPVPVSLTFLELSAPPGVLHSIEFFAQVASAEQVVSARWNFGDGPEIFLSQPGATTSIIHDYLAGGTFLVTFTAIDASGLSGSITQPVVLTSPVPEPETYAMLLAGLGLLGFEA